MSVVGVILETDPAPRYREYLAPPAASGSPRSPTSVSPGALMWIAGTC